MKIELLTKNLISLALVLLVACSASGAPGKPTQTGSLTRTSIQFSWVDTIEFSGFYEAQEHGYYAQENLEVRLDKGGFDAAGNYIDPVQRVVEGQADFGIFSADGLILARAKGQPVVAIAAIYQRSPLAIVSLQKSNLRAPRDFIGKRVGVNFGSDDAIFMALLAAQDIAPTEVTIVAADPSLNALIKGDVDAQMGFLTNEPVALQARGYEPSVILPADYGLDLYSNVIFTTDKLIAAQPDLIERFLRATLRGYKEAIADPKHAAQLSVKRNPELSLETELASMQASLPLLKPAGSELGLMTAANWNRAHEFLVSQKLVEPINVNQVYTLAFLNKIYK